MKIEKPWRVVLYGFLLWLIPFIVAMLIFPIHDTNRPLFESIMPVVIAVCMVGLINFYFGRIEKATLWTGLVVGLIWYAVNVGLDLLMFMWGPMKMSFGEYMSDIGVTYIMIPVITTGTAYLLQRRAGKSA